MRTKDEVIEQIEKIILKRLEWGYLKPMEQARLNVLEWMLEE